MFDPGEDHLLAGAKQWKAKGAGATIPDAFDKANRTSVPQGSSAADIYATYANL